MSWTEPILDILRKMYFYPVVYCLYEKTRKEKIAWTVDQDRWIRRAQEGGIEFILEHHYDPILTLVEPETKGQLQIYTSRGVNSLYALVRKIEIAPEDARRQACIDKYLKENC